MLNVGNVKMPVCHGHGLSRRSFLSAGTVIILYALTINRGG